MSSPATRIRVIHVITHVALGGAERVAVDLACELRDTYEPTVFAVRGKSDDSFGRDLQQRLAGAGIPVFHGSARPATQGGALLSAWRLGRLLRAVDPHLVHLHTEIPEFAYALAAALFRSRQRVAVVRTIHNSEYWTSWNQLGRWTDRRLATASIVAVSAAALRAYAALRSASGAAPPPRPAQTVYNGLDDVVAISPRRKPTSTFRLLAAGRLEPQKGSDLLPEIVTRTTLPPGTGAELEIYGRGSEAERLRRFAAAPPRGWRITIHAPAAGLANLLPGFDAVLMPSRFEGLSLLGLETVLAGVPLVATRAPGLDEQIPDDHPWTAAPGDAAGFAAALSHALADPARREASAVRARDFARQRFSHTSMLAGYRTVYRTAVPA